jgi:hypothetical protein
MDTDFFGSGIGGGHMAVDPLEGIAFASGVDGKGAKGQSIAFAFGFGGSAFAFFLECVLEARLEALAGGTAKGLLEALLEARLQSMEARLLEAPANSDTNRLLEARLLEARLQAMEAPANSDPSRLEAPPNHSDTNLAR